MERETRAILFSTFPRVPGNEKTNFGHFETCSSSNLLFDNNPQKSPILKLLQ